MRAWKPSRRRWGVRRLEARKRVLSLVGWRYIREAFHAFGITEAEGDRGADIRSDQAGVWVLAVEPEGFGGGTGAVVLDMYSFHNLRKVNGLWVARKLGIGGR